MTRAQRLMLAMTAAGLRAIDGTQLTLADLRGPSRRADIVAARASAFFVAASMGFHPSEIGQHFNRDRVTVEYFLKGKSKCQVTL